MGVRAAILGTGYMGIGHAKRLKTAGAQVVCICNRNAASRMRFKEELQDESISEYEDFDEMLEKEEFDVLFICIPPFAQGDQFEKAAEKGIHIFIEKPIAMNTVIGERMVKAAENNHIITSVGFHMRYGEAVKKLKNLIEEGKAGRPVLFHGHWGCNSLHSPWWKNVDLCGGQIFEQAIHVYDLCRYFIGDPKFVAAIMNNQCHSNIAGYTIEDVSASISGFTNGAIASITANNCEIPDKGGADFKVVFEKVVADFTDFNHAVFTYTAETPVRTEIYESEIDPYMDEVLEFLHCVEEGKDTSCNIKEGYKSLVFVEKAVESTRMDGIKVPVH